MALFGGRHRQSNYLRHIPNPGETASPRHLANARHYAESLRPQAREAARRLAQADTYSTEEVASASAMYQEVLYRISADNNWRLSVKTVANEIADQARHRYPADEEREAGLAAYLSGCAAEALVFMLPTSGSQAAMELMMTVGGHP